MSQDPSGKSLTPRCYPHYPHYLTLLVPARLAFNLSRMLILSGAHGMSLRSSLASALVRTAFGTLTGKEMQQVLPSTRDTYSEWINNAAGPRRLQLALDCKGRIVNDIQILNGNNDDSAILWLGDRHTAKKVVIFFHGGGFVLPASRGHFEWPFQAYVVSGIETGVETAVACLQYTLASRAVFPIPLRQAVAAYNEIRRQGFQPRDIIVGGDSAGANLAMQFLSHILHTQPGVPEIQRTEPFAGAFFVSPWLGHVDNLSSFRDFSNNDMVNASILKKLLQQSVAKHKRATMRTDPDPWLCLLEAKQGWLQGLDGVVAKVYISCGEREVLRDHSREMVQILNKEAPGIKIETYEAPNELHNGIILEYYHRKPGTGAQKMKTWFKGVILD